MEVEQGRFRQGPASSWLILLPGPPRELYPMFLESVVPLLDRVLPTFQAFVCRTLRSIGIGESVLQERIQSPLHALVSEGVEIGYCARPGQVDVRLVARGAGAVDLVSQAVARVVAEVGDAWYGEEDDTLEARVIRSLEARRESVAIAESCTGGLIAHRLTNIPGASAMFAGAFVTYSNGMKEAVLGVRHETLSTHGAVSEPVAKEMAEGARQRAGTAYALAVTGIAGPDGGTAEKPVGTVFIALATPTETRVWRHLNSWDRATFKEVTAGQALNYLRLALASPS
jgi:nicotinamide-nucleotide amidase